MDLTQATTGELTAEVERRLGNNEMGFSGLYSSNQQDFREAWTDAMQELHRLCNEDFERWQPHRQLMVECLERHVGVNGPSRRRVYAVNTTYHGRDAEEDHAPESEAA